MRNRAAFIAVALVLALSGSASAQTAPAFSSASPPDKAALDRLNLRNEWTAFLPLDGRRDAIALVQTVDENQIFVQSRSGLLIAIDARTGAKQWTFRFPADYSTVHPVAVSEHFVFAVNVARLFCFHRYNGVLEFNYEVKLRSGRNVTPTAGPIADRDLVYLTMNGNIVVAYRFPTLYRVPERNPGDNLPGRKLVNPVDSMIARYTLGAPRSMQDDTNFDRPIGGGSTGEPPGSIAATQRTPSVSALPVVTPPYTLANRAIYATPSLSVTPSLRQPYQLKPEYMRFNQRTPSITVIPPSVARVHELANLRPPGIQPIQEWEYGSSRRLDFQGIHVSGLIQDPSVTQPYLSRLWLTTDGSLGIAVSTTSGRTQVYAPVSGTIVSPIAGPLAYARPDRRPTDSDARTQLGFVGLVDGTLLAVDLLAGDMQGARVEWRANIGGLLNHRPVVTDDSVFASGDHAGIAKVDVNTGTVIWKSEADADRILAVNQEFVYARDRVGNLLVYDRKKATDEQTQQSRPLAKIDLSGFNVPITNHQTDRILLGADSGLLVCLRDNSPKYVRPFKIAPPLPVIEPPKKAEDKDKAPSVIEEPKKDEPKKDEPKKDEPKKDEKAG